MKITTIIATAMMGLCCNVSGQTVTVRDVFKLMPDSLLPCLTQNNKLDLLDFVDSKMDADVKNKLDEHTRLTRLTDSFMHIDVSEASTIELRLLKPTAMLPDTADAVVCFAQTLGGDNGETVVNLYTSKWHLLETIELSLPPLVLPDTLNEEKKAELNGLSDNMMAKATLSEDAETLTVTPTLPLLSAEDKAKLKPYLRTVTLMWNGITFK